MSIGIKSLNGLPLNEGVVVSIEEDTTGITDVVIASGERVMKISTIDANVYSRIKVRACGYVFGNYTNVGLAGYVDIKIGSYTSPPIYFRVPATGAGDWFYIPFSIESSNLQQTLANINLTIYNSTSQQFEWSVSNFCVEGII